MRGILEMPQYKNNSKYKTIKKQVSAATRYDPRIGRRVSVRNYSRDQYIRDYKTISLKIAEKAFEERSKRAKTLDRQKTSKIVLEEPNEKWKENINKMDVKGIDTKISNFTTIESLKEEIEKNQKKMKEISHEIWKDTDKTITKPLYERIAKLQEEINKMIEIHNSLVEERDRNRKAELFTKRKGTIKEDTMKLEEMKLKMRKTMKGKYEKEIWDEQEIKPFDPHDTIGILDYNKITLLTTNRQMEGSIIANEVKENKQIKFDIDKRKFILSEDGEGLYEFDNKNLCGYKKEYIDIAFKSLNNPKVFYQPRKPLIIKDETFTYAIAPRDYETWDEDEDDGNIWNDDDYEPKMKSIKISKVKISPKQYKKLQKIKKEELIEQYNELSKYDVVISPDDPKKFKKEELIGKVLRKYRDLPQKIKQQKKVSEDIAKLIYIKKEKKESYIKNYPKEEEGK